MRSPSGEPVGFMWLMRNATGQMTAEEALQLSQRMDELSCLAHGLVHEFRNILASIQINADIIRVARNSRHRQESVEEIQKGCEKAASLLGQFRAFKSNGDVELQRLTDGGLD
jgi:hypothetical protein